MRLSRRTFTLSAAAAPLLLPVVGRAQDSTPVSTDFEPASSRITELLQYAPGGILDERLDLIWNDPERQVSAVREYAGEEALADFQDDQIAFTSQYVGMSNLFSRAYDLENLTGYAFDQLLQSVEFGTLPNGIILVKLGVPAESLIPFWESAEYEMRENEFGTFWTISETAAVDLGHPIQRSMLSSLNNIAILDDDVIAYSQTSETLDRIMSTAAGESPTRIAELESILVGLPEDANSAWFLEGDLLLFEHMIVRQELSLEFFASVEEMISDSDAAVGLMPPIATISVGLTAGGHPNETLHNPDIEESIILETSQSGGAERAAEVITWRVENLPSFNTGEPYSELLPGLRVEVLDGALLRASRPLQDERAMLARMIQERDLLFLAYS